MKNVLIVIFCLFSLNAQAQWNKCCCDKEISETCILPKNEDCILTFYCGGDSLIVDNRKSLTYVAEDNDNLTNRRYNHSFGNGTESTALNVLWGAGLPCDAELVSITMSNRTTSTNASVFQPTLNGSLTGFPLTLPPNTNTVTWSVGQDFAAGSVINFWTITGNNINDSVITYNFLKCE